ncbi:MAG: hypothetical protein JWM11_2769 [Planctomycetaceae bacterium]|nr:hypothetical protein [Planctomycetaceae bacterium]
MCPSARKQTDTSCVELLHFVALVDALCEFNPSHVTGQWPSYRAEHVVSRTFLVESEARSLLATATNVLVETLQQRARFSASVHSDGHVDRKTTLAEPSIDVGYVAPELSRQNDSLCRSTLQGHPT